MALHPIQREEVVVRRFRIRTMPLRGLTRTEEYGCIEHEPVAELWQPLLDELQAQRLSWLKERLEKDKAQLDRAKELGDG